MAGIIVSGGTYSGSGDVTTDFVIVGGTQTDGTWAASTFICPDGVLTITDNSAIGYVGTAVFLRDGRAVGKDTWTHNDGTVRFTGTDLQKVIDYSNGEWYWYNVEIQNNNTTAGDGVWWGYPWASPLNFGGDLTISGNADCYVHNKETNYFIVSGTVSIISGAFTRNSDPITSDNSFGALAIGANGTYTAAANGGEVLSITKSYYGDHYAFYNKDGGTFTHNNGTVSFDMQDSYQNVGNNGQWFYNLVSTNREPSYHVGLQQGDQNLRVANDFIIASGAHTDNSSYNVTVSGTVYCSGTWGTTINVGGAGPNPARQKNKKILGGLVVGPTGAFTAPNDTGDIPGLTFTDVADASYAISVRDDVPSGTGSFYHNSGTVTCAKIAGGVQELWLEGNDLYNLNIAPVGGTIVYISNNDLAAGLTVANDLNVTAGKTFKTFGAGLSRPLTVSGTATISGTLGVATETSDWTFGALDIESGGTYEATTGETIIDNDMNGTINANDGAFLNEGTFIHNSGTVVASGGTGKVYINFSGTPADTVFYNLTCKTSTDYTTINNDITVENILDNQKYFMMNGGYRDFDLTLGTTSQSGIFNNPAGVGTVNLTYAYFKDVKIKGASEVYPAVLSGTSWNFANSGQFLLENVHMKDNYTTKEVAGGCGFTLTGPCEFAAFTVKSGDTLNCSGQRAEFGGQLENKGTVIGDDSLLLADGLEVDGTWSGFDTGDIIQTGDNDGNPQDTTSFGDKPRTYFVNIASGDTLQPKFYSTNWGQKVIIGNGTYDTSYGDIGVVNGFNCDNLMVANGGTLGGGSFFVPTGSFSNRGGLFASSSAVDLTATTQSVLIPTSADFDDNPFDGGGTMEWWVNLDADGVGVERGNLFSMWTTTLRAYFLDQSGDTCKIRFVQKFSTTNPEWETGQSIPIGKWVHIAITYDNDAEANDPLLYIDGKLTYFPTATRPTGSRNSVGGYPLYLGNDSSGNDTLDGRIGMFRYFKTTIRTPAQIRTDMFNQYSDMDSTTGLKCMLQFDEGEGTTVTDVSTQSNNATLENSLGWTTGGTWTAGGILSSSAGNLYIGNRGTEATIFASSKFVVGNRKLIEGSKFASKAHENTLSYYIDTSGTADYLAYQQLTGAPIGSANNVEIMPNSYFTFDTAADNEQCHTLLNDTGSIVRINSNEDFYTQDFENKGTWLRNSTYGGIIHDDGSTPHEYEPIDIMDDQDSGFDTEDLID